MLPCVHKMMHLKILPAGVIPQCMQRPRPIINCSFSNINQNTLQLVPVHAMQFGWVLQCILHKITHANPKFGPTKLIKIDLMDGYCCISVSSKGIKQLGIIIPSSMVPEPQVVFLLSLPMGWLESPPLFCMFAESI